MTQSREEQFRVISLQLSLDHDHKVFTDEDDPAEVIAAREALEQLRAHVIAVEAALRHAGTVLSTEIADLKRAALERVHYSRDEDGWRAFSALARANPGTRTGREWAEVEQRERRLAGWREALDR